jgi:hypothetical protein
MGNLNEGGLSVLLEDSRRELLDRRVRSLAMAIAQAASGHFPCAAVLAAQPFPCRLTSQELVELLKMPTCFGTARRVVLDHLGNRYGQRFVNHWAFVRYAREHNLSVSISPHRLNVPIPRSRSSG